MPITLYYEDAPITAHPSGPLAEGVAESLDEAAREHNWDAAIEEGKALARDVEQLLKDDPSAAKILKKHFKPMRYRHFKPSV